MRWIVCDEGGFEVGAEETFRVVFFGVGVDLSVHVNERSGDEYYGPFADVVFLTEDGDSGCFVDESH